jgi:uncharacterized repeat protein (TIGR01451 family)
LTVEVMPNTSVVLSATATISADQVDGTPENDIATVATPVSPADLAVSLSGPTGAVALGDSISYTITVTNLGPTTALNVNASSALPADTTFVSATPIQGVQAVGLVGDAIVALVPSLAPGVTATYSLVFRPTGGTALTHTVTVTSNQIDAVPANNSATIVSPIVNLPGVAQFSASSFLTTDTSGAAVITVVRTGGTTGTISVDFSAEPGTAVAGTNFTPVSGTLTFLEGETTKTFTVPILPDGEVTGDKTVVLLLSDAGSGVGSQATATLTIRESEVDTVGPRLANIQFLGNSVIVLSFSEALDPAAAQNPLNYSLTAAASGRGAPGGVIPLSAPVYDPATRTVTLSVAQGLADGPTYSLTLNSGLGGLTDRFGNLLDGDGDGLVGGPSVVTFVRGSRLNYTDTDGDRVSLRLRGAGTIELIRGTDAVLNRIRLAGVTTRSTLSGSVRRNRLGDGMTHLGTVEGLGAFTGGARSRLTAPPFVTSNLVPLASLARALGRRAGRAGR